jgi:hypothetical protein
MLGPTEPPRKKCAATGHVGTGIPKPHSKAILSTRSVGPLCASSCSITENGFALRMVLIGLHWLVKETREHIAVYNKDSRKIRGETPAIRLNTTENWLELLKPQSNAISVKVRFWSFIISLARLIRCASR